MSKSDIQALFATKAPAPSAVFKFCVVPKDPSKSLDPDNARIVSRAFREVVVRQWKKPYIVPRQAIDQNKHVREFVQPMMPAAHHQQEDAAGAAPYHGMDKQEWWRMWQRGYV
jgi:hypothetical protein